MEKTDNRNVMLKNKVYWMLMLFIGILFYILNYFTPFIHDDYAFAMVVDPDGTYRHLQLSEFFPYLWERHLSEGRMAGEFLEQLFAAVIGKPVFNFFNTAVFLLFLHLIVVLSRGINCVLSLSFAFFAYMILLPDPAESSLWMIGSLNFLWPITMVFVIVYLWKSNVPQKHMFVSLVFYLFVASSGLFLGLLNESTVIGTELGLLLHILLNRLSVKKWHVVLVLFIGVGLLMHFMAPGFQDRASSGEIKVSSNVLSMLFLRAQTFLFMSAETVVILLAMAVFLYKLFRKRLQVFDNLISCLFFTTAIFVFAAGVDYGRVYFPLASLALVYLLKEYSAFVDVWRIKYAKGYSISCLLVLFCLIMPYCGGVAKAKEFSDCYNKVVDSVIAAPKDCVVDEIADIKRSRFVYSAGFYHSKHLLHNKVRAGYYGKNFIQALPSFLYRQYQKQDFLEGAVDVSQSFNSEKMVYRFDNQPYYIVKVKTPLTYDVPYEVKYSLHGAKPVGDLKLHQKVIRYLLGTDGTQYDDVIVKTDAYEVVKGNDVFIIMPEMDNLKEVRINNATSSFTLTCE